MKKAKTNYTGKNQAAKMENRHRFKNKFQQQRLEFVFLFYGFGLHGRELYFLLQLHYTVAEGCIGIH